VAATTHVERGILYNSHLETDLFNRVRSESKTADDAMSAFFGAPKDWVGRTTRAAITNKDPKMLLHLRYYVDEPTQCIVDGIVEGMGKDAGRAEDVNPQLRL
jgi:hypothetical protein